MSLLEEIERYLDAAPRRGARVEEVGPFTLFVREGPGWPWYARPRLGETAFSVDDVLALRARQLELGVPQALEWIHENTPALTPVAAEAGLKVNLNPLLVLGEPIYADTPRRVKIRRVADEERHAIDSVAHVAFGAAGTARGDEGVEQAAALRAATDARPVDQAVRTFAAFEGDEPVSVASHIPLGSISEVAGVGTLPDHRRKGLGAALTAAAVADARGMGVETIFLTAGSEEIARVYERLGFERVGTGHTAEAPEGA
jgi:predicted GNAT family acetyltransferase